MTTFFLLRHAAHDNVGRFLAGRAAGIYLGSEGRAQAERLGLRMAREQFSAIFASPRERTQETAQAVAAAKETLAVHTADEIDEIDFGYWSGRTFDDLNEDADWRRWNTMRSVNATPAGETILQVQARAVGLLAQVHRSREHAAVVLVTHSDVIKVVVAHYLGLALDHWPRFDVDPASITTLQVDDWGAKLVRLNEPGG